MPLQSPALVGEIGDAAPEPAAFAGALSLPIQLSISNGGLCASFHPDLDAHLEAQSPVEVQAQQLETFRIQTQDDLDYLADLMGRISEGENPIDVLGLRSPRGVRLKSIIQKEKITNILT